MSPRRLSRRASLVLALVLAVEMLAVTATEGKRAPEADATALYNAGTAALSRGSIGRAVAYLTAASRLEPRASDVRANLERSLAAAARLRGEERAAGDATPGLLSTRERWWLAAFLVCVGSLLGIAGALRAGGRRGTGSRVLGLGLIGVGLALAAQLAVAAREEAIHPEAVVVTPTVTLEGGPGAVPSGAVLLTEGERVRVGRSRGSLVEIRLGGNSIGWAPRAALWQVRETPRYTPQNATP